MNPGSIVCICGAGTMGSGIAQLIASKEVPTIVYDVDPVILHLRSIMPIPTVEIS